MATRSSRYPKLAILIGLACLALAACAVIDQGEAPTAQTAPMATGQSLATTHLPAAATATLAPADSPQAPTETDTPTPTLQTWAVVARDGTLSFDSPGGLSNVEHSPDVDNPLTGGQQIKVESRNAASDWLQVDAFTAGVWIPASDMANYLNGWNGATLDPATALAQIPVSTQVFPTMGPTDQWQATEAAVAMTAQAQGQDGGVAVATYDAAAHPSPTPTAFPWPILTVTPGPNCHIGSDKLVRCTLNGQEQLWDKTPVLRPDYVDKAVHGMYARFLDLVMAKNGPPQGDIRELLKEYMLPRDAVGQPGAAQMSPGCTYGDIAKYLSRLQAGGDYLRIISAPPLKWDSYHNINGSDYELSLPYLGADNSPDAEFHQSGAFTGVAIYELVSIKTGQVLKTAVYNYPYTYDADLHYLNDRNGWFVYIDDFCSNVSDVGAWTW